jgi:molybdate/tungstate transport system substrate-binding protein
MHYGQGKTVVRVVHAGSLIVPFDKLEVEFEKLHPDVDLQLEGHGSIQAIRYVTELHHEADVLVVADYSLIPMMMYSTKIPGTEESYTDWYLKFATNSLGIAYTPSSQYADEITEDNWYEILARPGVSVGISDARFDACGYRAFMVCQLAELYYNDSTIFGELIGDAFVHPVTVSEDSGVYTIQVPELLQPVGKEMVLRSSSVWLLALLDSGDADYAFEYQSVAEQHGLEFLKLPEGIDLGSADYADLYARVKIELAFQRFSSIEPEFIGEPIVYGATIPRNALHPDLAAEFVKFVISPKGQEILLECYQPAIVPAETDNWDNLPVQVKEVIE